MNCKDYGTKLVREFREFFCKGLKNIWGTLTPDDRKNDPVYCRDIYGNYYRVTGFGEDKENHRAIIHLEKVTDI
jgi:hypothetical protein